MRPLTMAHRTSAPQSILELYLLYLWYSSPHAMSLCLHLFPLQGTLHKDKNTAPFTLAERWLYWMNRGLDQRTLACLPQPQVCLVLLLWSSTAVRPHLLPSSSPLHCKTAKKRKGQERLIWSWLRLLGQQAPPHQPSLQVGNFWGCQASFFLSYSRRFQAFFFFLNLWTIRWGTCSNYIGKTERSLVLFFLLSCIICFLPNHIYSYFRNFRNYWKVQRVILAPRNKDHWHFGVFPLLLPLLINSSVTTKGPVSDQINRRESAPCRWLVGTGWRPPGTRRWQLGQRDTWTRNSCDSNSSSASTNPGTLSKLPSSSWNRRGRPSRC